MSTATLASKGLGIQFGGHVAVDAVSAEFQAGTLTAIVGPNGAGKSTTLRTIIGLWQPSAGSIELDGADLAGLSTPDIARRGIAFVPEDMGVFANLTVQENLRLAAIGGRMDDSRLQWIFSLFPALERFWLRPGGTLSGGQKQMVAIARAIIEPRRLLLIDEPTKGLAPSIVQNLASALRALKAEQTTILLVEQNFHFARALGDDVAVMDDGHIVHTGRMDALAADASLQERLLGLGTAAHA